ncbi:MAG: SMC-Scp complex subunit ScpB [Candidatus Woesearchaeota archaeon]
MKPVKHTPKKVHAVPKKVLVKEIAKKSTLHKETAIIKKIKQKEQEKKIQEKRLENKKAAAKTLTVKTKNKTSSVPPLKKDSFISPSPQAKLQEEPPILTEDLLLHEDKKVIGEPPLAIVKEITSDALIPETNETKLKIEALLFASGKSLSETSIAEICEIDKRILKKNIFALQKEYDVRAGALMIIQDANGWKITVREKYLSIVRKIVADTELAKSIMETLAIIAWKTPIYQSELVKIRGNKCYDHVAELEESGFIVKEKKGRSFVLKTTEKFYTYFDINSTNLAEVMSEAKMPSQQTLSEAIPQEGKTEEERKIDWEKIQIVRKEEHPEEEQIHREFLEAMDQKIGAAALRTHELSADLPSGKKEKEEAVKIIHEPSVETTESMVFEDTLTTEEILASNIEGEIIKEHKPKSLTKKQLEKKFKEDLVRVREKMGKVMDKK